MQAKCREFISAIACQHAIRLKWCGGIQANIFVLFLAYVCPFLLCTPLVKFSLSNSLPDHATEEEVFQIAQHTIKQPGTEGPPKEAAIPVTKKLDMFYTAPRTKFCVHTVSRILLIRGQVNVFF